jgi:hypothetical protein
MKQLTLAAVGFERYAKTTRRAAFLAEMEHVVPWSALCALIQPFYPKPGNGRPPIGVERMLRIYFLQQWFNLSDPAAEEAVTGRTENFLRGRPDLDDTIKRLKAYEAAGIDALMAPGLPHLEAVRAVCAATEKPFNFMVGIKGKSFTVAALAAAGVKRISLATSLYRAAMTGLLNAAKEVRERGTFGYIDTSLATLDMNAFLRE